MIKSLKERHDEWAGMVIPDACSKLQKQEMERSFYSGAYTMLTCLIHEIGGLSDKEADVEVKRIYDETKAYFFNMKKQMLEQLQEKAKSSATPSN